MINHESTATAGTPRTRALAAALREARESAGVGVRELVRRLDISHATLSHWETGKRVPRPEDVAGVLTAIGVNGQERERIIDLARNASEPNWLAVGVPGASQQLAGVMECERTATTITDWSPLLIPGLLQTSDYARTIMSSGEMSRAEVEARVHLRMARRDVLTRREPVMLIGEPAIRDCIGGPAVMADQLRHMLRMVELDTVTVQIVSSGTAGILVSWGRSCSTTSRDPRRLSTSNTTGPVCSCTTRGTWRRIELRRLLSARWR